MSVEQSLVKLFNNNFCAYFRAHVAHVNTQGRFFISDHKILGKIYEDLQGQIDVIAEILRTLREFMPSDLHEVHKESIISESQPDNTDVGYLEEVYNDIEMLIEVYLALQAEIGDNIEYSHIGNYAQDRVTTLQKFCWMLRATLDDRSTY